MRIIALALPAILVMANCSASSPQAAEPSSSGSVTLPPADEPKPVGPVTFAVADVEPAKEDLPSDKGDEVIRNRWGETVEAHSQLPDQLIYTENHPLLTAIQQSFMDHRPLVLSPDMIWLLIAQGFALHINQHSEELRERLVEHEGKVQLVVRRDDFIKGSEKNPWPQVFPVFLEGMKKHLKTPVIDALTPTFTTTGATETVAYQIAAMEAMGAYFEYLVMTLCGIPSITLEGTPEDWEEIYTRTRNLAELGDSFIKEWLTSLLPILDEFKLASMGRVNGVFWESIYRALGRSGQEDAVTGWILAFFPYLLSDSGGYIPNPYSMASAAMAAKLKRVTAKEIEDFSWKTGNIFAYPDLGDFPAGASRAPFVWEYLTRSFEMDFIAGFLAIEQRQDRSLRPHIAWAVRERDGNSGTPEARQLAYQKTLKDFEQKLRAAAPKGFIIDRSYHGVFAVYRAPGQGGLNEPVSDWTLEENPILVSFFFSPAPVKLPSKKELLTYERNWKELNKLQEQLAKEEAEPPSDLLRRERELMDAVEKFDYPPGYLYEGYGVSFNWTKSHEIRGAIPVDAAKGIAHIRRWAKQVLTHVVLAD